METLTLTGREATHLIAALRNWQVDALNEDLRREFGAYFGADRPLSDLEIDALVERLLGVEYDYFGDDTEGASHGRENGRISL